jgi:secretion/DNA translocation related CpaE-like protein
VNANRPVAFVTDEALLDELLKAAATAGCDLERVLDTAAARTRWSTAPLVLLDLAGTVQCKSAALPKRAAVVVVTTDPAPEDIYRQAVGVGAEQVITLPAAEPWLVNALADAAEGPPSDAGRILAVLGARGGAGASVFAAAVGLTAMKSGENALLVDCDPRGGGLDLVLGAETEDGLRWPDMQLSAGRVAAASLHVSLPTRTRGKTRLTLLSGARRGEGPGADAVAAIAEAGKRAGEVVVCDVSRQLDVTAWAAIDRADLTAIVTPAELRACITAKQLATELTDRGAEVQLLIRGPSPGGLKMSEIASYVEVPVLTMMRPEPQIAQALDRGTFDTKPRSPLTLAARKTLAELASLPPKYRGWENQQAA